MGTKMGGISFDQPAIWMEQNPDDEIIDNIRGGV